VGDIGETLTPTITPLRAAKTVPEWWGPLYGNSASATIFLSPEWLQSWLDIYAGDFDGEWVRWTKDGDTVGGCLLLRRTVWWRCVPQPTLFLNVAAQTRPLAPWSEYNQALYVSGHEQAVAASLALSLRRLSWARLEFWGYVDTEFSRGFLAALPANSRQLREQRAPYVDLEAFRGQDYEATLSSKTRSQIRRTRRMYGDAHGPVEIEFAQSCEEALSYLQQLAALHNAVWRARGQPGSFERDEFRAFHQLAVRRLWSVQAVDLLRVRAKDKVIGYLLTFKRGGKIYCYQSGLTLEADKNLKTGFITHATAIAEYARRGFREYDLLAGDVRYKRSLTKNYRTMYWSTVYRNSLFGSALWGARRLKARLRPKTEPESSESAVDEE
jgi:CelD/BcsL family acetyltransferase involved in cellulose biosynthesis